MSETTATSKSLERKTKKELVEIILRKDSVEQSLRKDIAGIEKQLKETRDNYSRVNGENVNLKKEIELANETAKKASSTIKYLEGENRDLFKKFNDVETELEILKSDFEETCDELATINQEKKDMQKSYIVIGLLLVIGLVLAIVL